MGIDDQLIMTHATYHWEFQDPKMEVRKYHKAIFCGDIPLHSPEK